ncbi:MAG: phosphoenolpyruvate--protein phosphotransferase, partial [Gammaproteobacteria bacterium]|nr:phosphoenolpyruvate--protein phosphotransferase [Gammaproteobacteria bacterium]
RFQLALKVAQEELKNIRTRIPASTPADIAAFIDTHLLMLKDSALGNVPIDLIRNQQLNAEWALKLQRDALVNIFEEMDDAYLRTRKDDVIHVVNRILRILLNQDNQPHDGVTALTGHIIIADDLTPADTILLQHQKIAAFVTEYGGPLSHTAIMARSLRIPAVVGVHNSRKTLHNDEIVIVDGKQGVILANIDEDILSYYRQQQQQESIYYKSLNKLKNKAAITIDGTPISLLGNIELPEDIDSVNDVSASGVGLFRTEFLFMNRSSLPDEEEQLDAYLTVINKLKGNPLTIRTLDLGADKQSQETKDPSVPTINPALGLRAIRLCLKDPDLFTPQLRAILRASAHGPIRMMIPMLSNIQEALQTLQIIEEAKHQLDREGLDYDKDIPVGGMIEIPAAAITAYTFAKHLDFLSIGTNDLIQ